MPNTETELELFALQLDAVKEPEDLFGKLDGPPADQLPLASTLYKRFARIAHPDRYAGDPVLFKLAEVTFSRLSELWHRCQTKIMNASYGNKVVGTVASRTETFLLQRLVATGDVAALYVATGAGPDPVLVKAARGPASNPFLEREVAALQEFRRVIAPSLAAFIPEVKSSFLVKQPGGMRAVTVFKYDHRWRPLPDVLAQYPQGLDPRHLIWIGKRLMSVLGGAHEAGIVHGAVLPEHVLIRPADHALCLVDWCFSTPDGTPIAAVPAARKEWYPPEVHAKRPVGAQADLYMAARVLMYVANPGETPPQVVSDRVPDRVRRVLAPCLLKPAYRPPSAWAVYDALDKAALRVYGEPKFVQLDVAAGV